MLIFIFLFLIALKQVAKEINNQRQANENRTEYCYYEPQYSDNLNHLNDSFFIFRMFCIPHLFEPWAEDVGNAPECVCLEGYYEEPGALACFDSVIEVINYSNTRLPKELEARQACS